MRNIYFHLDFLARFTRYFRTFVSIYLSIYNVSIEAMTQIAQPLNVDMNGLVRLEAQPEIPSPKEAEERENSVRRTINRV